MGGVYPGGGSSCNLENAHTLVFSLRFRRFRSSEHQDADRHEEAYPTNELSLETCLWTPAFRQPPPVAGAKKFAIFYWALRFDQKMSASGLQ